MYWVINLRVLSFMQNQIHVAKTYATSTLDIISALVSYISSFTLQEGWHIYIEWVNLFLTLCSPSIMISIGYLQENEGIVQKDLEYGTLFITICASEVIDMTVNFY